MDGTAYDSVVQTFDDEGGLKISVSLISSPLDISGAHDFVTDPSCGAIATFVGTTRDNHNGRSVTRLEYEAHSSMAAAMMLQLAKQAAADSAGQLKRVYVAHRLGNVPVKEASILIAVSSPHRPAALAAVGWLIDEIKARVPVWKKEWYADGSGAWKANSECCWGQGHQQHSHAPLAASGPGKSVGQSTAGMDA